MNTSLHLLSMPMHDPLQPSCQLGYLQGYFQNAFRNTVPVHSHSAYLDILFDVEDEFMVEFYSKYRLFGEEIFFLVCCYGIPRSADEFDRVFKLYNDYQRHELKLSKETIAALAKGIDDYLEREFIPSLQSDRINIVGLTTTFSQVFASIYAANYIRSHTGEQLLFVFGGASMSLPEATRTLDLWRIEGLMVVGSGEARLAAIVQSCLDLNPEESHDVVEAIDARNLVNVTKVGLPRKLINLEMPRNFLETIPDPDYDEFFSNLRSHCDGEGVYRETVNAFVAIPLEGSRGCFARCDFCQNPDITSQFRTLKGIKVAERSLNICDKYGKRHVFFADSVCNSWAEDYADHLLSKEEEVDAFMEMRVHAPETFWIKLALSGVSEIQLGVEAATESLLNAIDKGTTVMQNLSASKYLAELRVKSLSNLITHHPKSTVRDVEQTMQIIRLIEHFPEFCLSRFVISYASPIYKQLTETQKTRLERGFDWLPPDLKSYSFPRDLAYSYPPEWLDPEVVAAWDEFRIWYESQIESVVARKPVFTIEKNTERELFVVDSRFGQNLRYSLEGARARIYGLCHNGLEATQIVERSRLEPEVVREILTEFVDRSIVARIGDRYLSLAFRPREELVENLLRKGKADRAARLSLPSALITPAVSSTIPQSLSGISLADDNDKAPSLESGAPITL